MDRSIYPEVTGSIFLWRYKENEKNYPAWNFSASPAGTRCLISILQALKVSGGVRTLPVTPPTPEVLRVPNNRRGTAKWFAPQKWKIIVADGQDHWHFPPARELAILTLGHLCLDELIVGVSSIFESDYRIGNKDIDQSLWFWAHPSAYA